MVMSMRRGAAAIPMKIAEACGREDGEPYAGALRQARGMGTEMEYLLLLARGLLLVDGVKHDALKDQVIEVRRMLSGVIKRHSTAI